MQFNFQGISRKRGSRASSNLGALVEWSDWGNVPTELLSHAPLTTVPFGRGKQVMVSPPEIATLVLI